ncbi:tetratricopeptide repeat protein [Nitrincola sp.]|uniref:tetratricopeptide repeat protein n=1 Tax=Nitrincola sp. TaxID=1926584 RepID=UPI003A8EEDD1
MNKTLLGLLAGTLLTGCTGLPHDSTETSTHEVVDLSLPEVSYQPGELNREILFDLLSAEMGGHYGRYDEALASYIKQARLTGDAAVAERATRIAQFMRDSEAVLSSASIWAEAAPHNSEPRELLAGILLHEGRFDEALPWLESVLSDSDSDAALLISSQTESIDPNVASQYLNLLNTIIQTQPDRTDLHLALGLLHLRVENPNAAMQAFDRGLAIEPYQPQLVMQKAELLRKQNRIDQALQLVSRAVLRHQHNNQLQIQQAQLLMLSGNFSRAELMMTELLELRPQDTQLHLYFALLLLDHERYEASRELLEALQQKDPQNSEVDFYLGHLAQQRGERDIALLHYSAVNEGSTFLQAQARSLELLNSATDRQRVENILSEAISRQPGLRTGLVIMLAEWYKAHNLKTLALQRLNSELQHAPNDTRLLYTRALFHEPEQPQQTLNDLRRALELDPTNPMYQNALGYTLTQYTQHYEEAHHLIAQALAQQPDDPATLDSMGWVLFKLKRTEEALSFLQRAYAAYPDTEVAGHLIRVLDKLERREEAVELLEKHLQAAPDDRHLLDAAEQIGAF